LTPPAFLRALLVSAAALSCTFGPAAAQQAAPAAAPDADRQPVLLRADTLDYDETGQLVTATGNVEVSQGDRLVLANRVVYDQRSGIVTATGNVRMVEPTGEVMFAEYAQLTEDLAQGVAENFRMLLADDSRLAAADGRRTEGRYTTLNRAVYSPCNLCPEDPTRPPIWQLKAREVLHDNVAKDVIYRDARLEIAGIPVAYTPYFAHPDPTVDRRTGFLSPRFGSTSELGPFLRGYYYWDIAPDKDATLEAMYSGTGGPLIGGEYRQRFANGQFEFNGSLTRSERAEENRREESYRGHIFSNGRFDLTENWRSGFELNRTTDDNYLRIYDYSEDDLLVSRGFAEGFYGRNYALLAGYSFQDLRPGVANPSEPLVLPLARYTALGEPGATFGGRWAFDTNLLAIARRNGRDTRRLSADVGWQREQILPGGVVGSLEVASRADGYWTDDRGLFNDPTRADQGDFAARLFPRATIQARYPLVRPGTAVSQTLEPIIALRVAPNVDNNRKIPNEDSLDLEFDDTNLFADNRYPGFDRIDDGHRFVYGLRYGAYGAAGGSADLFLGQSYRLSGDSRDFARDSGLEDDLSDYVGRVSLNPSADYIFDARVRFDEETLSLRRGDFSGFARLGPLSLSTTYSVITRTPLADREQLSFSTAYSFADYWSIGLSNLRDFESEAESGSLNTSLSLSYADECLTVGVFATRDYTTRRGIDSGDSIFVRLVFKNLGEVETPQLSSTTLNSGK